MKKKKLTNLTPLSSLAISSGINTWEDLIEYVKNLPYARNSKRDDFSLVLTEKKGSCSSKHALLKIIADENEIQDVKLILAIYKMNSQNTPGIGMVLIEQGLDYVPEAHCLLKINGEYFDYTSPQSAFKQIEGDILSLKKIQPNFVICEKINFHQDFIKEWLKQANLNLDFKKIWLIRENCIKNLV